MQAEFGAARAAIDLDQSAMVADDLGDQCQAEPAAGGSRGDERLEQMRADVVRNARPVVAHHDAQRQIERAGGAGNREPHAVLEAGGQHDLRMLVARPATASAAFFTRFSTTCTSWSRLPQTGGSDGS